MLSIDPVSNAGFRSLPSQNTIVTTIDNDVAGITITVLDNLTSESGDTAEFLVQLDAIPTADVIFDVGTMLASEVQSFVNQVTFTATNWNTPQRIILTGIDDSPPVSDGSRSVTITTSNINSIDTNFNALTDEEIEDVLITNQDNDAPSIVLSLLNNNNYEIPKLIKHLCFLDKKTDKLIVDDKTLNYIDEYIRNLSKIERLLLLIRSDLNNMDFYMLRTVSELIDDINLIIFEFEISINFFKTTENVNKLQDLKHLSENIKSMITSKVIYLDILNSRILSIVSLSALPVLVLMTIWSTTVKKEDSILYKNNYKFAYRSTYLLSILLVLGIIYKYRKDFH